MTTWDKIYKEYKKTGKTWATLAEGIDPFFEKFLEQSDFNIKYVLDIGCGTGQYLKLLQSLGFKTDGIDSSETAVKMTKDVLKDDSQIKCINMFEFDILQNKYDLIISISTIHHGTKEQVQELINKIFRGLVKNGKMFITLPDLASAKKWNTFKDNQEIAEGTYAPLSGPEKGLAHSFYTKEEIKLLFLSFKHLKIKLDKIGRWYIQATK